MSGRPSSHSCSCTT